MHRSTQTIEDHYTVEGPNEDGKYRVDNSRWKRPGEFMTRTYDEMVEKHIASLPKVPCVMDFYEALQHAESRAAHLKAFGTVIDQTDLSEEEAIELMALLGKVEKK